MTKGTSTAFEKYLICVRYCTLKIIVLLQSVVIQQIRLLTALANIPFTCIIGPYVNVS